MQVKNKFHSGILGMAIAVATSIPAAAEQYQAPIRVLDDADGLCASAKAGMLDMDLPLNLCSAPWVKMIVPDDSDVQDQDHFFVVIECQRPVRVCLPRGRRQLHEAQLGTQTGNVPQNGRLNTPPSPPYRTTE